MINVTSLNLKGSKLDNICDDTLDSILQTSDLKWLSLAQNNLTKISQKFQLRVNNLDKLWLSGNPFHCGCDMIWMIDWIGNATAPSGGRLVQDYQDITCVSGLWKDTPVFQLNDSVPTECKTSAITPKYLPNLTILIVGVFSGFMFPCLVIILVYKNKGSVRQWVYKHFEQQRTSESVDSFEQQRTRESVDSFEQQRTRESVDSFEQQRTRESVDSFEQQRNLESVDSGCLLDEEEACEELQTTYNINRY